MRVKMILRLVALAMMLSLCLALPALAESCVLCGEETGSDCYLCPACLLDLLAEEDVSGGLEITGAAANEDGSVTLSWQDGAANGPYAVYYELLDGAPVPFGWLAAQNIRGSAVTLTQLAPGVSYVFTVKDAAGHQAECVYCPSVPGCGNEIGAKITIATRLRSSRMTQEAPFSAGEIMLENGREHCLYIKLSYSMLRKTRYYDFTITVKAPNGFTDVILTGDLTLNYGRSEVPAWSYVSLEEYFSCLERYYGGVPAGEYLVTMNFDGKPACSAVFPVGE